MFDLSRILSETSVRHVAYHAELPSTNDFALQQLKGEAIDAMPLLVLTQRQTHGRGRGENRWWSSEGALTFSLVLPLDPRELPPDLRPLLALTAGLAVRDALGNLLPTALIQVKWPNDVYLNGRKVCGILIELPARPPDVCVVGIGVNVNNSFAAAPPDIQKRAIALSEVSATPLDPADVLIGILQQLDHLVQMLIHQPDALVAHWQTHCLLTGRRIGVRLESQWLEGICEGIDHTGHLILRTAAGIRSLSSGTIEPLA